MKSFSESIDMIEKYGFFFVRDTDDRVCGLVTAADLTAAYRRLTTPYFQLGEIERRLRHCINTHFSTDQMRAAVSRNKNRINSADDMDFGQYKEVLGNDARWGDLGFGFDQVTFIDQLDKARKVRNKIMHFGKELTPAGAGGAGEVPQPHAAPRLPAVTWPPRQAVRGDSLNELPRCGRRGR